MRTMSAVESMERRSRAMSDPNGRTTIEISRSTRISLKRMAATEDCSYDELLLKLVREREVIGGDFVRVLKEILQRRNAEEMRGRLRKLLARVEAVKS